MQKCFQHNKTVIYKRLIRNLRLAKEGERNEKADSSKTNSVESK